MSKPVINLQDGFLNQVRKESVPVTVYLVNGFQVRGLVKPELIYKHAISTIIPSRPLREFSGEPRVE